MADCAVCRALITGVGVDGRLTAQGPAHDDGTPHDTRSGDSGVVGNVDAGWFAVHEFERVEAERDVVFTGGTPSRRRGLRIPDPTVGSAWETWLDLTDADRRSVLRIGDDVLAETAVDRVAQTERDLALAVRVYGPDSVLDDVFMCPLLPALIAAA